MFFRIVVSKFFQGFRACIIGMLVWAEVQCGWYLYGYGIRQLEVHQNGRAKAAFQQVLGIADVIQRYRPSAHMAYELRALALYQMYYSGKEERVWNPILENINTAIHIAPDRVSSEGYMVRGMAVGIKGNLEEAFADLSMAIQRTPNSKRIAEAYTERAVIYFGKEERELALQDAKKGVQLLPSSVRARLVLALGYLACNQAKEAEEQMTIIKNFVSGEVLQSITNLPPWPYIEEKIREQNIPDSGATGDGGINPENNK